MSRSFFVVVVTLLSIFNLDSKTYTLGTYKIPLLVESETKGVFVEIFLEASKRSGYDFKLEFAPPKRTLKKYDDGKIFGYFPALKATMPRDGFETEPYFKKKTFAYVKKGENPPKKFEDLKGKKIGLTRGFSYSRKIVLNEDLKIEYANSPESNMRKLSVGRIDVFISDSKSGNKAIEKSGVENVHYDPNSVLSFQDVFFVFEMNDEGKKVGEAFNKALKEMKADGTIEKIYSKMKK